ncbi:MAG: TetR/AcrR family transcriptional regulator [Hyphomonadaceae bacterium]|nr:TetR/AcrR family transcriptional regulator [Hyphomonadaceae bacterium]
MSTARRYVSPKREAQAQATRAAILEAFAAQLSEPGRITLSPSEAAARAGVSLRTVHFHFPNEASQIAALGEWFEHAIFPDGVQLASGPDDLPRYYRDIHRTAIKHPISRALTAGKGVWAEVRASRRAARLDSIRKAVKAIGAPARPTAEATAMLLSLSGADASWRLHDHGLPLERIPEAIAHNVELILADLRAKAKK